MTSRYQFRKATELDIGVITDIYNSNKMFLKHHLGWEKIDTSFIKQELDEMKELGFVSALIQDKDTNDIIGVIDHKEDRTVYLSLLMLHKRFQGNGKGSFVYQAFEQQMKKQDHRAIRIDVVNDYVGNVTPFWRAKGFEEKETIELNWGSKSSQAIIMIKQLD